MIHVSRIPNFAEIIPGKLYRSGQPIAPGDWVYLKGIGIRTVLKLNYDDEGIDPDNAGLQIIRVPMPPRDFWQALGKPDREDVDRAVKILGDKSLRPLLWHCSHGQDRTGLLGGIYRVLYEGWDCPTAYQEMLHRGFHWELHDIHEYWEDFVREQNNGAKA